MSDEQLDAAIELLLALLVPREHKRR